MKVKQNLSLKGDFLYFNGRFYYGNAPMGSYPCKGCTERHEGCHAHCEAYIKAREEHSKNVKEELKHRNPGFSKDREKKLRRVERSKRR